MSGKSRSSNGMNALVAIIDPNLATSSTSFSSVDQPNALATKHHCECVKLSDPADASHQRTYLVTAEKAICELQAFAPATDYGSFFVNGAYVVANGNLHTVSPVDPLFWFLAVHNHTVTSDEKGKEKQQWQPLEQILADQALDRHIVEAVTDRSQLGHIFETMQLPGAGDDEECYYMFSEPKTLAWLTHKQQRVETVLWEQESHLLGREDQQQDAMDSENVDSGGGAFSSSFNVAADLQPKTQSEGNADSTHAGKDQREQELQQRCREESVQVVCTYLNSVWRDRFLLYLKLNETCLMSAKQRRQLQLKQQQQATAGSQINSEQGTSSFMPKVTAAVDWNDVNTTVTKKMKVEEPTITHGAKKLAKVNTKGMQKMSSFFGAKPPAKKENKKPK
jgi:hypothetical protein